MLIKKINLNYGRSGAIELITSKCDVCLEVVQVLEIDGSEGEYGTICICKKCALTVFDAARATDFCPAEKEEGAQT